MAEQEREKEVEQKLPTDSVDIKPSEDLYPATDPKIEEASRPFVDREFRAAWVASVANINWPSRRGLSSRDQQDEAVALLDFLESHHFNAVILQIRPQADALYNSKIEPWSYFLTGEQGKAPNPYYDPLQFWIEAAHDRGLELHAWLNPFRAHHTTGGEPGPSSIVKTRPELVKKLKNGMYWLDPGLKETREYSLEVVLDLISRYDVDGIHFDDYFYPYADYNGGKDFPDNESWMLYRNSGGQDTRDDWRRDNVNDFVQTVYEEIKSVKPHIKFGISPFGIWRPGYPESISGSDPYQELYADSRLWLAKGWVDYFAPQLYWKINQYAQSFPVLLGWWEEQNLQSRHLWPGLNIDFGGGDVNVDETINQIMITRGLRADSPGTVHWSIGPLLKYPELADALLKGPYQKKALVPSSPWLISEIPESPLVTIENNLDRLRVSWVPGDEKEVFLWLVYIKTERGWDYTILNRDTAFFEVTPPVNQKREDQIMAVAISAVSRTGNESEFKEVEIPKKKED